MKREPRDIVAEYMSMSTPSDLWDPQRSLAPTPDDELVTLQALDLLARRIRSRENNVRLVTTSPDWLTAAERTRFVLEEMLASARDEILILGYELSDPPTIRQIGQRTAFGVRADVVVDRAQSSIHQVTAHWPPNAGVVVIWETARTFQSRPVRLHSKAVVVDGKTALVTSANLTKSGLTSNLELGLAVSGPVAGELRDFARGLIDRGLVTKSRTIGTS